MFLDCKDDVAACFNHQALVRPAMSPDSSPSPAGRARVEGELSLPITKGTRATFQGLGWLNCRLSGLCLYPFSGTQDLPWSRLAGVELKVEWYSRQLGVRGHKSARVAGPVGPILAMSLGHLLWGNCNVSLPKSNPHKTWRASAGDSLQVWEGILPRLEPHKTNWFCKQKGLWWLVGPHKPKWISFSWFMPIPAQFKVVHCWHLRGLDPNFALVRAHYRQTALLACPIFSRGGKWSLFKGYCTNNIQSTLHMQCHI